MQGPCWIYLSVVIYKHVLFNNFFVYFCIIVLSCIYFFVNIVLCELCLAISLLIAFSIKLICKGLCLLTGDLVCHMELLWHPKANCSNATVATCNSIFKTIAFILKKNVYWQKQCIVQEYNAYLGSKEYTVYITM